MFHTFSGEKQELACTQESRIKKHVMTPGCNTLFSKHNLHRAYLVVRCLKHSQATGQKIAKIDMGKLLPNSVSRWLLVGKTGESRAKIYGPDSAGPSL